MKLPRLFFVLALLGLGLIAATASVPAQDKEEGFVSLFNGTDLTGWRYGKKAGGENKSGKGYQVENGILFCTKSDGGNLFTEKEFADFIFRFEVKIEENGNNGVGIRAPLEGDAAYVGMEIQVLDDYGPQYKSKLKPWQYHGSIYGVVPVKPGFLKPAGEWNTEEIYAKGRQIKITLNGTVVVDANLDDVKDEEILKSHRDLKKPEGSNGIANAKGHIGFLGHGARVEFRNLRIKEL